MKIHSALILAVALFVAPLILSQTGRSQSFQDDFNRADSAAVGNGWSDTTGNSPGNLAIQNQEVILPTPDGRAGIFRPFAFTKPIMITATVKEMNGYGGVLRRYGSGIRILNDGVLGHGYGVVVSRGDANYPSGVNLYDGETLVAQSVASFQFGPEVNVQVSFDLDGSVSGTVSDSVNCSTFSFGPRTIQSGGNNVSFDTIGCDSRSSTYVYPRMDNFSITAECIVPRNAVGLPELQWPLPGDASGYNVTDGRWDYPWISECGGLPKRHVGLDLTPKTGSALGLPVFAAADGFVVRKANVQSDEKWGDAVIIEHIDANGEKFTTGYLHIDAAKNLHARTNGKEGTRVMKGDTIGTIAAISDRNSHLHFSIRRHSYDGLSFRGALPDPAADQGDCHCKDAKNFDDPVFPENFINPLEAFTPAGGYAQ